MISFGNKKVNDIRWWPKKVIRGYYGDKIVFDLTQPPAGLDVYALPSENALTGNFYSTACKCNSDYVIFGGTGGVGYAKKLNTGSWTYGQATTTDGTVITKQATGSGCYKDSTAVVCTYNDTIYCRELSSTSDSWRQVVTSTGGALYSYWYGLAQNNRGEIATVSNGALYGRRTMWHMKYDTTYNRWYMTPNTSNLACSNAIVNVGARFIATDNGSGGVVMTTNYSSPEAGLKQVKPTTPYGKSADKWTAFTNLGNSVITGKARLFGFHSWADQEFYLWEGSLGGDEADITWKYHSAWHDSEYGTQWPSAIFNDKDEDHVLILVGDKMLRFSLTDGSISEATEFGESISAAATQPKGTFDAGVYTPVLCTNKGIFVVEEGEWIQLPSARTDRFGPIATYSTSERGVDLTMNVSLGKLSQIRRLT